MNRASVQPKWSLSFSIFWSNLRALDRLRSPSVQDSVAQLRQLRQLSDLTQLFSRIFFLNRKTSKIEKCWKNQSSIVCESEVWNILKSELNLVVDLQTIDKLSKDWLLIKVSKIFDPTTWNESSSYPFLTASRVSDGFCPGRLPWKLQVHLELHSWLYEFMFFVL